MARSVKLSRRIVIALASSAGWAVLRLLGGSWRMSCQGPDLAREHFERGLPYVGLFWHNRILALLFTSRGRRITTLISRHSDGEIIARIAQRFGHGTARGSSSRGAVAGLKGLLDAAERGTVGITPDGPRGPCYSMQPGAAELAIRTGRPVMVTTYACDRAWRARSWDRFIVPKPFARVQFRYRMVDIPRPPGGGDPDVEEVRRLLERELRAITREAEDELNGTHDERLDEDGGGATSAGAASTGAASTGAASTGAASTGAASTGPPPPARLVAALALAPALVTALLPRLLAPAADATDPRGALATALLLSAGLATALGPALTLAGGARAAGLLGAGLCAGALAAAAPGGAPLLGAAALGSLYPLALLALGAALARLLSGLRLAPLLAALPGAALILSIFALGPLVSLAGDPGGALALLLRGSAVTALTGSLLEVDLLRAAPLYQLVPAASEAPFRYPGFGVTLEAPALLAAALSALACARAKTARSP